MSTVIVALSQTWMGTLVGLLGLVAAAYFYFRSRRPSRLGYQRDDVTLVGTKDAAFPIEVEVRFAGVPVRRVTSTRFVLWNAGRTTLRSTDVVQKDPLRVDLGEAGSILKVTTARVHRDVNGFELILSEPPAPSAEIRFDFLDPGDGARFEVLHSGGLRDLRIAGTLRGLPEGPVELGQSDRIMRRQERLGPMRFVLSRASLTTMAVFGTLVVLGGVARLRAPSPSNDAVTSSAMLIVTGLLYLGMSGGAAWIRRRRYPADLEAKPDSEDAAS